MDDMRGNPLFPVINAKLELIAAESVTPPSWYGELSQLGLESPLEERLTIYQAIRDSGDLPAEAGFYLVSWLVDLMMDDYAGEELTELEDRVDAIKEAHGLGEDDYWPPGEGPPEYHELGEQVSAAWDALYADMLEEFGEQEMARLFRSDRERFEQIDEVGRHFFHGPDREDDEADWLVSLRDAVSSCVQADSAMGPLGLRYGEEENFWEVCIYPTPVELVGGAHDGAVVEPGFTVDLEELRTAFDSIAAMGWNALGLHFPEGPHVYVEGVFQGREVFLQILAHPPEDEKPGIQVDTTVGPRQPE